MKTTIVQGSLKFIKGSTNETRCLSDLDKGVQECFTASVRQHVIRVALYDCAKEVQGENLLNDDHRSEGQKIVDAVRYITNKYPKLAQFVIHDKIQLLQHDDEENQLSPQQLVGPSWQ